MDIDLSSIWNSISGVKDWVSDALKYIYSKLDKLNSDISDLTDDIYTVQKSIRDVKDWVEDKLESLRTGILSHVTDNLVKPLSDYVDAWIMDVQSWVVDLKSDISNILSSLESIFDFIGRIDDIIDERIESYKDKIVSWIEDKFIYIVERVLQQEVK